MGQRADPGRVELARHVARNRPLACGGDRGGEHHRRPDLIERLAVEVSLTQSARGLLDRGAVLDGERDFADLNQAAHRGLRDRATCADLCVEAKAGRRLSCGADRRADVAQPQSLPKGGERRLRLGAVGVSLFERARRRRRLPVEHRAQRLARHLAQDGPHHFRVGQGDQGTTHDVTLHTLKRGDESSRPHHRFGQDICSERKTKNRCLWGSLGRRGAPASPTGGGGTATRRRARPDRARRQGRGVGQDAPDAARDGRAASGRRAACREAGGPFRNPNPAPRRARRRAPGKMRSVTQSVTQGAPPPPNRPQSGVRRDATGCLRLVFSRV